MGAEHQSWPYRAHRAVPDEMACEWQECSLPFRRQAGPYVHQWQAAAMPPPNTWDPGDNSKVPSSSECNWGEVLSPSRITVPLMKVARGGSRRRTSPGPGTHSAAGSEYVFWVVVGISSGTPGQTVVPVRRMSESLPPGMEEKLEQPTCCCLSPWIAGTKGKSI